MRNLIYGLGIFMLGIVSLNASNTEKPTDIDGELNAKQTIKVEQVVIKDDATSKLVAVVNAYRGRCLDGTTFTFTARNRSEAQGFVNGYCAAMRQQ